MQRHYDEPIVPVWVPTWQVGQPDLCGVCGAYWVCEHLDLYDRAASVWGVDRRTAKERLYESRYGATLERLQKLLGL